MSSNKTSQSLRTEVSKLARLSNVQGGLPPLMRGLPVIALIAGEAISKATKGQSLIEERLLGVDEAVVLQAPSTTQKAIATSAGRPGVNMMCQSCGMKMDGRYVLLGSEISRMMNDLAVGSK